MLTLYKKAKAHGFPEPEILPKDKNALAEMAKKVGMNYSWILVCFIYQRKPQNDIEFFEVAFLSIQTMIAFCQKVLEPAFDEKDHRLFEEELNRLFRTNEFNVAVHIKAFRVPVSDLLQEKNRVVRKKVNELTDIRPLYTKKKGKLYKAANRSPLISLLFPSKLEQTQSILK